MKLYSSHTFISTSDSSYSYGDLIAFAEQLQIQYNKVVGDSASSRVLVLTDRTTRTAFLISACFLNQIPMVILPVEAGLDRIQRVIKETDVTAIIDLNLEYELDSGLPVIEFPRIKSNIKPHYIQKLPSFDFNKLFAILFTSGTTSEAKAVPLKFKQVLSAAKNSSQNLPLGPNDEWLLNLPLHHIGGISVLIRSLLAGSKVFLLSSTKQSELGRVLIQRSSITHASLVPTQLKRLLDDPDFKVGSSFKYILLGGGPIPASVHRLAIKRNIPVIPSFGMTETAAQCIATPVEMWDRIPVGASGILLGNNKISLRKDTSGESELLWIKGDQVFEGYLDEKLNENSFDSEGWFNTGDYASIDENGFIYIEMRRSDRIVSGGENINPFFVEDTLEAHQNIAEAGVFGIQDDEWGQVVCAAIVLKNIEQILSIEELSSFLKAKLPGYMIPKRLILVNKLPRTASGKLIRSELINLI